jgi:RNA polymerase sigma-70 factor (ECF subfamily)
MLAPAREGKGRFRSFLRVACKNFLVGGWRRRTSRAKPAISIDSRDAENRYRIEPVDSATPERLFDRAWAITLLDRTLEILAARYAEEGKAKLFDALKILLTEGKGAVRAAVLAERLGTTENAVNVASYKLRCDYRDVLLGEITATLLDPADLDDEIRSLFGALGPEEKKP